MNDRCDWIRARLGRLLDSELPGSERGDVEAHCATCAACGALLTSLRSADRTVGAAVGEPVGGVGKDGQDDAFERRWARFQRDHDLAAMDRARAFEMQAGAGAAAPMSGEEVAVAPFEAPEPMSLAARVRTAVAGWFAPRPVWRWASLAGGAAVVALITTVLIARNPEVRGPETLGASKRAVEVPAAKSQQVAGGGAVSEMPSATIAPEAGAGHAVSIAALEEEARTVARDEATGTVALDVAAPMVAQNEATPMIARDAGALAGAAAPSAALERAAVAPSAAPERGGIASDVEPQAATAEKTTARAPEQPRERATEPTPQPTPQPTPVPASEPPRGPTPQHTWGDLERLYPVPQALRAGSEGKKSTTPQAQYRVTAESEPPSRAEVFTRLADLASELDVAGPADLEHVDPDEVADLLVAMERALAGQSSQSLHYMASPATAPGARAGVRERDATTNATMRAMHLATQWVLAGDGWFSLLPEHPSSDSRRRSADSPDAKRDGARGSHAEARATDADSLAARALSAYEEALTLARETELGEGTVPAYVTRRIEVLRGWIKAAEPPAQAAPPTRRRR
jgi:hypothetical protein